MITKFLRTLALVSLLTFVFALSLPSVAFAAGAPPSYSALADFSVDNGNPNGVWTYGWMPVDFGVFTAHTMHNRIEDLKSNAWYTRDGDHAPLIWLNTSGIQKHGVPDGWLSLHPGPGNEPSVLRWTAPMVGDIHIKGTFFSGDSGAMNVAVRFNGASIWTSVDFGDFNLSLIAMPGDTIDFAVYGGYGYGNTPLDATISYYTPQVWRLDSAGNPMMEKVGTQDGSIPIETGATVTWLSDQKTSTPVAFGPGTWTVYLETTDLTGDLTVRVGESDGSSFTDFAPPILYTTSGGVPVTLTFNIPSETVVPPDHYLALKITNSTAGSVITDGRSYLRTPESTPGYPLPEMPAVILLGLGLTGMGIYCIGRNKKKLSVIAVPGKQV